MSDGRCIFEGEFGEIRIPDLLTFLDMLGKTGTLEVSRDGETKRLYWENGEIVFADSDVPAEQVGEYLCRNGWVLPEALAEAKRASGDEKKVVKALIASGALDAPILIRGLKSLVLDLVYSIFDWESGRFRFVVTGEAHAEKVPLRTSVSNVIMEGSRRLDEWRRIRERIPDDEMYPTPMGGDAAAETGSLEAVELEILERVDGRRTVSDIVRQVSHDQFTVLAALHALLTSGFIGLASHPIESESTAPEIDLLDEVERTRATRVITAFNTIFAGIHRAVAAVKGDEGTRRFAATIQKPSFQRTDVLAGISFQDDGTLGRDELLANLAQVPGAERLPRLRASLDRLLAQQVLQLDTAHSAEDKKAISDLIAREKARAAEAVG